jgi:hypothetical protein
MFSLLSSNVCVCGRARACMCICVLNIYKTKNQLACTYSPRLVEFVSFNLCFLCWWFILRNLQNNSNIVISALHGLWGDLHIASLYSSSYNSLCALSLLSLMGTSNADSSRFVWHDDCWDLWCAYTCPSRQLRMETDWIRMGATTAPLFSRIHTSLISVWISRA